MTQFFTAFDGPAPLDAWTERFRAGGTFGTTWTAVDELLRLSLNSNLNPFSQSYDPAGVVADAELVCRWRVSEIGTSASPQALALRVGDVPAGELTEGMAAYVLGGIRNSVGQPRLSLTYLVHDGSTTGSRTTLAEVIPVSGAWAAGEWIWLRFRAEGDLLRGRVWRDADPEPAAWQIEVTHAALSDGLVGVASWGPSGSVQEWGLVGVGTAGDDAPVEPVEEPEPTSRRRGRGLRETWDWPGWG